MFFQLRHFTQYEKASLLAANALQGRACPSDSSPKSLKAQIIYHNRYYRFVYVLFCLAALLITLWETPDHHSNTTIRVTLNVIDFSFMIVVFFDLLVQRAYHGREFYYRGWIRTKIIVLIILFINAVLHASDDSVIYSARLLRPVLLIERLRNVRKIASNVIRLFVSVLNVAVLQLLVILLFSVMGFVLYAGIDDKTGVCTPYRSTIVPICSPFMDGSCSNYFASLVESMTHLFVLSTSANFPSIMLPAFKCNSTNAIFFIVFLLLSYFLILNLMLAVVYNTFRMSMKLEVITKYKRMFRGFDVAFNDLCTPGSYKPGTETVKRRDFVEFYHVLRPDVYSDAAGRFFDVFDADKRGEIDFREFRRLMLNFGKLRVRRVGHTVEKSVSTRIINTLIHNFTPSTSRSTVFSPLAANNLSTFSQLSNSTPVPGSRVTVGNLAIGGSDNNNNPQSYQSSSTTIDGVSITVNVLNSPSVVNSLPGGIHRSTSTQSTTLVDAVGLPGTPHPKLSPSGSYLSFDPNRGNSDEEDNYEIDRTWMVNESPLAETRSRESGHNASPSPSSSSSLSASHSLPKYGSNDSMPLPYSASFSANSGHIRTVSGTVEIVEDAPAASPRTASPKRRKSKSNRDKEKERDSNVSVNPLMHLSRLVASHGASDRLNEVSATPSAASPAVVSLLPSSSAENHSENPFSKNAEQAALDVSPAVSHPLSPQAVQMASALNNVRSQALDRSARVRALQRGSATGSEEVPELDAYVNGSLEFHHAGNTSSGQNGTKNRGAAPSPAVLLAHLSRYDPNGGDSTFAFGRTTALEGEAREEEDRWGSPVVDSWSASSASAGGPAGGAGEGSESFSSAFLRNLRAFLGLSGSLPGVASSRRLRRKTGSAFAAVRTAFFRGLSEGSAADGEGKLAPDGGFVVRLPRHLDPHSRRGQFARVIGNFWFTLFFDVCVMINCAVGLAQLVLDTDEETPESEQRLLDLFMVQYATLGIFLSELLMKAYAWGPLVFWRDRMLNKLEVCLAVASVIGIVLESSDVVTRVETSAILFLRFFRLIRVFRILPGFGLTVASFIDIVPVLSRYFIVMACVMYAFSIIAISLFHSVLDPTDPNVVNSSYGQSGFYALNFDSFGISLVSLFYLLVMNDWPVIMEGIVAGMGTRWPRLFFVFYWVVCIVVSLNVVIAFVIEAFATEKQKRSMLQALQDASTEREMKRFRKQRVNGQGYHISSTTSLYAAGAAPNVFAAANAATNAASSAAGLGLEDSQEQNSFNPNYKEWKHEDVLSNSAALIIEDGVEDWRKLIKNSNVDFSSYILSKNRHHMDIYDAIYKDDIRAAFAATFAPLREPKKMQ